MEHDSELYILFVDLQKAYDSIIPRAGLWLVLERLAAGPPSSHAFVDKVSARWYGSSRPHWWGID